MIKGEDALDTSSCSTLKPISGYDPDKFMVLVRNPAYDPSTDSTQDRENNVDGVVITIDTNTTDIYNKIQSGDLDGNGYPAGEPPATILSQYLTDRKSTRLNSSHGSISYAVFCLKKKKKNKWDSLYTKEKKKNTKRTENK